MPGFVYFAIVFAAGFALGTVRTLWLAPAIGSLAAVAIELPFMLAASWMACGWCLRRFSISDLGQRARMGALAFLFLMAAEASLAVGIFGLSLDAYAAGLLTAAGMLGLTGQLVFAAMPLLHPQGSRDRRAS